MYAVVASSFFVKLLAILVFQVNPFALPVFGLGNLWVVFFNFGQNSDTPTERFLK
jgi:hypothetical protein